MMIYMALAAFVLISSVSASQFRWQPSDQQSIKVSLYSPEDSSVYEDLAPNARVATSNEQVDRLASPSGDTYWRGTPTQVDRYLMALAGRLPVESGINSLYSSGAAIPVNKRRASDYEWSLMGEAPSRDYDTLVNEFKHLSHLSGNPMRENRAFKPKLMSTARGFGKRSPAIGIADQSRGGLYANDGLNQGPDGKMSGGAIR